MDTAAELAVDTPALSRWRDMTTFSNVLTTIRILLTPVFVWCFLSPSWIVRFLSLAVFVFAAITDWWDGHIARKNQSVTSLGKFLDPLADKLLTIAAMLTFVYEFESLLMLSAVVVIFARDLLLTWMRIRASQRGETFATLWLAKLKTTVQLTVIITIILVWCLYSLALEFSICPECVARATLVWMFDGMIAATAVLALISGRQYLTGRATQGRNGE